MAINTAASVSRSLRGHRLRIAGFLPRGERRGARPGRDAHRHRDPAILAYALQDALGGRAMPLIAIHGGADARWCCPSTRATGGAVGRRCSSSSPPRRGRRARAASPWDAHRLARRRREAGGGVDDRGRARPRLVRRIGRRHLHRPARPGRDEDHSRFPPGPFAVSGVVRASAAPRSRVHVPAGGPRRRRAGGLRVVVAAHPSAPATPRHT